MYYLDTSAWLKRYYDEAGSDWVRKLFRDDVVLACATLGLVEVYATLARKYKAGQLKRELYDQSIEQLERDWDTFTHVDLNDAVLTRAKNVTQLFALRGADAIHLASALYLQGTVDQDDEIILVTADQEMLTAAHASGLARTNPSDAQP